MRSCTLALRVSNSRWPDRALWHQIRERRDLVEIFKKAQVREKELAQNSEKAELYFSVGLDWKSIAELGGGRPFFERSLKVYEAGIEKFGQKNILFYLNAGKLAEHVDDLGKAEIYYKKAIAISPGDESGYIDLAEMFEYRLKKSKDEVVAVFHEGEKKMVNPTPLLVAEASYLRRVGDFGAALKIYKLLNQAFPTHQGFKEIIQELEAKIKQPQ